MPFSHVFLHFPRAGQLQRAFPLLLDRLPAAVSSQVH